MFFFLHNSITKNAKETDTGTYKNTNNHHTVQTAENYNNNNNIAIRKRTWQSFKRERSSTKERHARKKLKYALTQTFELNVYRRYRLGPATAHKSTHIHTHHHHHGLIFVRLCISHTVQHICRGSATAVRFLCAVLWAKRTTTETCMKRAQKIARVCIIVRVSLNKILFFSLLTFIVLSVFFSAVLCVFFLFLLLRSSCISATERSLYVGSVCVWFFSSVLPSTSFSYSVHIRRVRGNFFSHSLSVWQIFIVYIFIIIEETVSCAASFKCLWWWLNHKKNELNWNSLGPSALCTP